MKRDKNNWLKESGDLMYICKTSHQLPTMSLVYKKRSVRMRIFSEITVLEEEKDKTDWLDK